MTKVQLKRVEKFVVALESGEYTQGIGALRIVSSDGISYCCLGVATEVYRLAKRVPYPKVDSGGLAEGELAEVVRDYYGFPDCDPILQVSRRRTELATVCNDVSKFSFKKIALLFRKTYLENIPSTKKG